MILSPKTNYLLVFPLIYSIHYFRMYFSKGDVKLNAFNIKLFNPKISRIMDFYTIQRLILWFLPTLNKGQNLFGIFVSILKLNKFIIV